LVGAGLRPRVLPTARRIGLVLPSSQGIVVVMMAGKPCLQDDHSALILAIAQRADRAAFRTLFGHFAPRVKAWMLRAGSGPAAAEELAQETMLQVWRKAALFDPDRAGAATWIFTIARNLRIDAIRRERHPGALLADGPDAAEAALPDRLLDIRQREARLREAVARLPPEQARVIQQSFFEDKPHADIEKELGIPLGTVKSRLRLAMSRLRAALEDLA
jgi:RNA polymerase sigma-70 factor, ECF subfamily